MAAIFSRVRFVGSSIFGVIAAIPVALLLSRLTARREGFLLFLLPLAIVFTAGVERGWAHARQRDSKLMREESHKRYAKGKPPIGEG